MREKMLFCDKWEFCKCPVGTDYDSAVNWQAVQLPHDWLIYNTKNLYETSTGWYRKTLTVPDDGKQTLLCFEGVYMDSTVYVNGEKAFEWKYGYTSFEADITDFLRSGENLIAVRVDYRSPNSRWYSGAGIYRKVWLLRRESTHILHNGIYISAGTDGTVHVTAETERPESESGKELCIRTVITRPGDSEILAEAVSPCEEAKAESLPPEIVRSGQLYTVNTQHLNVERPELWDIDDPRLYLCTVSLMRGDEIIDEESVRFGFRQAEMTCDKGFFLNGKHIKLHGVCEHHDLGALGAAFNKSAMVRKLKILRSIGVNAIRTSHNPPAPEMLDAADEMGFLVLDEFLDMWELKKTEYDYARFFPEWVRKDAASWIRRDRNHPCVFGWSIGNEIYDTHASARGQEITSLLRSLVELHDPRKNGFATIGSNYMAFENAQRCADILKYAGYNYSERLYEKHHSEHPDWCIYGSETSSKVQSRGIYHFPAGSSILCEDDEQCSALGNSSPAWAAKTWEENLLPDRDLEYCAGQFIWTGFDYIGEPTPYSTKNSYFGQIDTAGFLKDSAYVYKAVWTDCETDPFIHIFPYWDFNEGEETDVLATTNCHRAKIFFNGEEIADKVFGDKPTELTIRTKLPYTKGELTAVAYNEDGSEAARDTLRSFGDTAELRLTADKTEIKAGSEELVFIEIAAFDKNGEYVANANNRIFVEVSGAGRLVGLDNGDSTDYEQYKGTSRRLFSGKLLAIAAPVRESGEITVRVSSPSLPDSVLKLNAVPAEAAEGIEFIDECRPALPDCPDDKTDIPVRKLELSAEDRLFLPERKAIRVKLRILPENAAYSDVEFRMTNESGIDSNLAKITGQDAEGVTVEALGDGEFYLRAVCRSGTDKIRLISQLHFRAEGLGCALTDPYEFVTGGLYTVCGGNVTNGIQHGAAIGHGGGWFGFENVDFGSIGSDSITVPLFANYSTPVGIRIYDGIPGEGGELIGDFVYDLKPKWLTYQPMTFKLNKALTGVHTIVIQSDLAYDVQGFVFEKRKKENAELGVSVVESIYGDKFTKAEDKITGIGNNVTVGFGKFSFETAPKKIYITGRSALPINSIHLIFSFPDGTEKRVLAEFSQAEDYTERAFSLEGISGKTSFSMVFLPGCDFDLRSIRFSE